MMYKFCCGDENSIPVEAALGCWMDLMGHSEFEDENDSDDGTEINGDAFQNSRLNSAEYRVKESFYYFQDTEQKHGEGILGEDDVGYYLIHVIS